MDSDPLNSYYITEIAGYNSTIAYLYNADSVQWTCAKPSGSISTFCSNRDWNVSLMSTEDNC